MAHLRRLDISENIIGNDELDRIRMIHSNTILESRDILNELIEDVVKGMGGKARWTKTSKTGTKSET